MHRVLTCLSVLCVAIALPTTAQAGGWATAGLSSLPPSGAGPGDEWTTQITLMQHGRTPLENVQPAIVVTDSAGKQTRFDATSAKTPGVYDVTVSFPAAGEFTYIVDDGFGNAFPHEFPPVTIGAATTAPAPVAPADDGGLPLGFWLLAGLALLLGGGAGVTALRRRGGSERVQTA